jgi:hypothetical protein
VRTESRPQPALPPSEVLGWTGFDVDEVGGARVGRVLTSFVDSADGSAAWLVVSLRRGVLRGRRGETAVVIPVRECAGAAGRVWTSLGREALNSAPVVDPTRPLLREHEAAICAHYGIGERVGRHAEIAGRPEGVVTSHPAAG